MRRIIEIGTALCLLGTMCAGPAAANPPDIALENEFHVITFSTPGVYDFSVDETESNGTIVSRYLVSHDRKGKILGFLSDTSDHIALTTDVSGTCKTSNGVTVLTEKFKGRGDLGNGDSMFSRATKRSEVHGIGTGATLFSSLKIKTCVRLKQPFSEKVSTVCNSGGGNSETYLGDLGNWSVRLHITQPVPGEILGLGTISTGIEKQPKYVRTTEVIAAGSLKLEDGEPAGGYGIAKIKLTPLQDDGDGPVTITARLNGVLYPGIVEVLEVKGKLLGQKFNEVVY
jgi:hypothetical protein